ncbi:hypothetical protein MTR_7g081250 [Medicago truncatula]|uniref:RNase H type-1 domain-containing protein n=1 Tax=Medicago truncatula TaxID=3880 RepID=G7KTD4_MEDTR|nr:hypothetical protein MTR_7g081250 [Medicago truncatula]
MGFVAMHTPKSVFERGGYVQMVVKMKVYIEGDVAEALAMQKVLKFAKDMSFYESYGRIRHVVLTLNTHQQSSTYIGSIIEDCISFNVCFRSLNFLHVRCEANQATNYLAKHFII